MTAVRKLPDLVVVSRDELAVIVEDAVRKALSSSPEWLTKEQAASLLGCSTRSISNYMRDGLPSHRRGGLLRFRRDEVSAWMKER